MKIGKLEIPDADFPNGIESALQEYVRATGDQISYIAQIGVDHPIPDQYEEGVFRLFAAYENLKSNPESGLAVIYVALALDCLEEIDKAVAVLESLDKAGPRDPYGLYDVTYEDPAFLAGYWLADAGRLDVALSFYQRSLARLPEREHGKVYAHIGSAFHELEQFDKATGNYHQAHELLQRELRKLPDRMRIRGDTKYVTAEDSIQFMTNWAEEQIRILSRLEKESEQGLPFSGKRGENGLQSS
jgi:tetratricopeptide (TPR) repeat protein